MPSSFLGSNLLTEAAVLTASPAECPAMGKPDGNPVPLFPGNGWAVEAEPAAFSPVPGPWPRPMPFWVK